MDQVGIVESLLKIIPFTSVKAFYYVTNTLFRKLWYTRKKNKLSKQ